MAVTQSGAVSNTSASPISMTLPFTPVAGRTLIVAVMFGNPGIDPTGDPTDNLTDTWSSALLDTTDGLGIYYKTNCDGGETTLSIPTSGATSSTACCIEDDDIDFADALDQVIAYAASGEGSATSHDFGFTAGFPAEGGLVLAACRVTGAVTWTGTNGASAVYFGATANRGYVFEGGVATGAGTLTFDLGSADTVSGALALFNYNSAGGGGDTLVVVGNPQRNRRTSGRRM